MDVFENERWLVSKPAVQALLARFYLFTGEYALAENVNILSNFALDNTQAVLHVRVDEHYENLQIIANGINIENDATVLINKNTVIDISCTPKTYTVTFNMNGKDLENQEPAQSIVYLNKVIEPADHYIKGEYISG